LKPNNLYFAIRGDRFDGHAFVDAAFQSGAGGAVVDNTAQALNERSKPLLMVKDVRLALQEIAAAYRCEIAPTIVGVTGSVGKSTVKEMIASMVGTAMPASKTIGNWNNDVGLPLSLLAMEPATRAGIFELGMNHRGEIAHLCGILRPSYGVVTPIGPVHTEFFDSVEEIAAEKAAMLESLPENGAAILNMDDPYFDILRRATQARIITVSAGKNADYVYSREKGCTEMLVEERIAEKRVKVPNSLPGNYNLLNVCLAAAVSRSLGVEWNAIAEGMRGYRPMPMRWEEDDFDGVAVVNDAYNANPISMRASITAFQERFEARKQWLVLAGMLELGEREHDEHFQLGEFVAGVGCDGLIAVGERGAVVADGAESGGLDKSLIYRCNGVGEAAQVLKEQTGTGDAVLLKASRGMALERVLEELKNQGRGAG